MFTRKMSKGPSLYDEADSFENVSNGTDKEGIW